MQIRPYGDTANDGIVQISFTLPFPLDTRARELARRYAMLMGISNSLVAHAFLTPSLRSWATMRASALELRPRW
jgi:hypothetical protein